ncbi:hypothetical protein DSO57_1033068 [Entomophthora muscae]|uniref:Uncharacterized protein n=1 Tax=Entomophthora muscae TaxID=34485 RepID=A0ACC2TBC3_9FUNG|nr:hypothetical protein DSO57_1033068 [Entomophthora muscae]
MTPPVTPSQLPAGSWDHKWDHIHLTLWYNGWQTPYSHPECPGPCWDDPLVHDQVSADTAVGAPHRFSAHDCSTLNLAP